MATDRPTLQGSARKETGSRPTRRLRKTGQVPAVVYGSGRDPMVLQVGARDLRDVMHSGQALFDLTVDGDAVPVVIKDRQLHPVRDEVVHVDFQEVKLDVEIESTVPVHLEGAEDAPGAKEGGVLEHITSEVTVLSLPGDIPESLTLDVSAMEINDTITLESVPTPSGVTITTDPETTVATLSPPRVIEEDEPEVEEETELIGEEGEGGDEGESSDEGSADESSEEAAE